MNILEKINRLLGEGVVSKYDDIEEGGQIEWHGDIYDILEKDDEEIYIALFVDDAEPHQQEYIRDNSKTTLKRDQVESELKTGKIKITQ